MGVCKKCSSYENHLNMKFFFLLIFVCLLSFTGRPRPNVTWYLDNTVIDESFEQRPDGVTVNHLSYPNIGRQHVNARFVCIASNTNLMPPNSKVLVIDVNRMLSFVLPHFKQFSNCSIRGNQTINFFLFFVAVVHFSIIVKPAAVHILAKRAFVSADKTYDIECKSSGSKPAAVITWWRGTKQIKRPVRNVSKYNV